MLESGMPKRSSIDRPKHSHDVNKPAFEIVQESIGEDNPEPEQPIKGKMKDPAAVALGRKGGLKGGKARAESMTKEQRVAQAKKAAEARWSKDRPSEQV